MIVAQISDIRLERAGAKFGQAPVMRLRTPLRIGNAADKPARPSSINSPHRSKFRLRTRLRASCPRVIFSMQRRQVLANAASLPLQTFETDSGGYTKSFLLVRMTVFLR